MPHATIEEIKNLETLNDTDRVRLFQKWLTAAMSARRDFDLRWERDRELVRGKIDRRSIPSHQSDTHINDLHMIIERSLAILTDGRPAPVVGGREPNDDRIAEVMKALITWVLDKNRFDSPHKNPTVQKDALVMGTGIWEVQWQGTLKDGDIEINPVMPDMIYPSPEALDFMDESGRSCEYVMRTMPMTLTDIGRRWPKKVTEIRNVQMAFKRTKNTPQPPKGQRFHPFIVQSSGGRAIDLSGPDRDISIDSGGDLFGVIETFYRVAKGKGRRAYWLGNVIIEDVKNPYRSYQDPKRTDEWPYVKVPNIIIPHEFWGMGEPEQIEPILEAKTYITRKAMDWIGHIVTPQRVIDMRSGVDINKLTNKPGLNIPVKPGQLGSIRWRETPPIPTGVFELINLLSISIETVSGIQDVSQGRKPGSVVAATAIARLQEAAQTVIRLKSKNTENAFRRMAELIVARIQQFYKLPRIIRIAGSSGRLDILLQSKTPQDFGMQRVAPEDFKYDPEELIDPTTGKFDIRMDSGSMLPVNKTAQAEIMLELSKTIDQNGEPVYVTRRRALRAMQFQDADQMQDEVLERRDIIQELQQQLQQAGQQVEQITNELKLITTDSAQQIQKNDAEIDRQKNNIEALQVQLQLERIKQNGTQQPQPSAPGAQPIGTPR